MPTWNKGHVTGQKPPLKPSEVWSIRTRLQVSGAMRDIALFNLAIDSKLRGCDLVAISVADVVLSGCVGDRAVVIQRKTGRPQPAHVGIPSAECRQAAEMISCMGCAVCGFSSFEYPRNRQQAI